MRYQILSNYALSKINGKFWQGLILSLAFLFASLSLAWAGGRADGGVVVGMSLEPPHLDPTAGAAAAIDEVVYANLFEGLTRMNAKGEIIPALAKSWEISSDGLHYRFQLQPQVKFHNGKDFTSADVVFSFERAMGPNSVNAQKTLFSAISKVTAVSPLVVLIDLSRPSANLLYNLSWGDAVIVNPDTADNNKTNPIGTGPFRFGEWVRGDHARLVRNDDYWGAKSKLSYLNFRFINDEAAATATLLAGDVDTFPNAPLIDNVNLFRLKPEFTIQIGTTEGETILAVNHANPALSKLKVRQALAYAIDRKTLSEGAQGGLATPIGSHFAPHQAAYLDLTGQYVYNVQKAKQLLTEAGYKPGELKFSLKLPPPLYARKSGELIAIMLKEVGIDVSLVPVEWAVWLDQVFKKKDYDLTIVSHTEPMDINIYARPDYYFNYQNPQFNEVMKSLDLAIDEAKRKELYQTAQKLLADDEANVFLFQLAKVGIWNNALQGQWVNSPMQANDMTAVYWGK